MKQFITHKEFASKLDGREYGKEITIEERKEAFENGLVVIYGASDDLMEINGAIDAEVDCWEGTSIRVVSKTLNIKKYKEGRPNKITSAWDNKKLGTSWSYETEIPHTTFKIFEDGDLYCIGIVFSIYDLK